MTVIEILAIIGALSWTYPLIMWLDRRFTRTKMEIINHKEFQIGYTSFGPILNIDLALSASKSDAFVKDISITLKHESNQTEIFKWEWFEENLMEFEIPDSGGIVPYKKNQKAIALKVLTNTLAERRIGFQKPLYHNGYSEQYQKTFEIYQNYISKNVDVNELKAAKEYIDFENFFKNNFIWKVGKYTGTLTCKVANSKKSFKKDIEFYLTNIDIRKLEANVILCLDTLENHFINDNPDFNVNWNWVKSIDTKNAT
jgi:hypothetical protein